jgi:hypothetical protein
MMSNTRWVVRFTAALAIACVAAQAASPCRAATRQKRYYAHETVEDRHGVIAPWYHGSDGLAAFRVRIAAETLKRYPWIGPPQAAAHVPEYLLSSFWSITPDGTIATRPLDDWMNGDRGQLAGYVLRVMNDYYRYSGDPAAKAHLAMQADLVVDLTQTPADYPWPKFCISVPVKGKPYGQCDPTGFIQLDIVGRVGYGLVLAYESIGERRWLDTARHWGDVLAARCDRTPGAVPWGRYANPEQVPWGKNNQLTGGVVWIAKFLDELIRTGHEGQHGEIVAARDAARAYIRDTLLPAWLAHDTWGRQYWDWEQPTQSMNVSPSVAEYLMDYPEFFSNWRNDARNILSTAINRACVSPASNGEVYSGAWAYPESCGCCGRCLSAGPWLLSPTWARLGVQAESPWAAELARRQLILCLYDLLPHGAAEDNIDGGVVTNGSWFESTHLLPLETTLAVMGYQPQWFAPPRENHMVRSASSVRRIVYAKGRIEYDAFDSPAGGIDVFRLAFDPQAITADGVALPRRGDPAANGFTARPLACGDWIVSIRHDGARSVAIEGNDPQQWLAADQFACEGSWETAGTCRETPQPGAAAIVRFYGNQVRLIGRVGASGGLAEVWIDGVKQRAPVDFWIPTSHAPLAGQTLFAASGLAQGEHELRLVARGCRNPRSAGDTVWLEGVQCSSATGVVDFGEGHGPTEAQRWIFGYPKRDDYNDAAGNRWKPGCEFVVRSGDGTDSVAAAWHTTAVRDPIEGTPDAELYRYGIHGRELIAQATVAPGTYTVRLHFAASRGVDTRRNSVSVHINGQEAVGRMDVAARAGGPNRALALEFAGVVPREGIIEVRLSGNSDDKLPVPHRKDGQAVAAEAAPADAFIQAMEVLPQKPQ